MTNESGGEDDTIDFCFQYILVLSVNDFSTVDADRPETCRFSPNIQAGVRKQTNHTFFRQVSSCAIVMVSDISCSCLQDPY